jgi:hypothetical protein
MPEPKRDADQAVREAAYRLWEREGRPDGKADDHWRRAMIEWGRQERGDDDALMDDEEKVMAGRLNANIPALLTKDVPGG